MQRFIDWIKAEPTKRGPLVFIGFVVICMILAAVATGILDLV